MNYSLLLKTEVGFRKMPLKVPKDNSKMDLKPTLLGFMTKILLCLMVWAVLPFQLEIEMILQTLLTT